MQPSLKMFKNRGSYVIDALLKFYPAALAEVVSP
jgi:hypothetical protein